MSETEPTATPRTGRPPTDAGGMAKQNIRCDHERWKAVGIAARGQNTNTSAITRDFYDWYMGAPGAKLPVPAWMAGQMRSVDVARVARDVVAARDKGATS